MATHQSPAQKRTVKRVMHEFKHGELKTARGKRKVKNPKQAIAIALSEAGASKYDSPTERKRNLRRTKTKERRGQTGQAAAEGRRRTTQRKSAASKSAAKKSAGARSAAGKSRTTKTTTTRRKAATSRPTATRRSTAQRKTAASRTTARRTTARRSATQRKSASKANASRTTARRRAASTRRSGGDKTRAQLYREAQRRDIPGRSKMSKAQLERALRR